MPYTITGLSALKDNYIWLIEDRRRCRVICVDPGDADVVCAYLDRRRLSLSTLLITHHHQDHTGGVPALQQRFPDVITYAPHDTRLNFKYQAVSDGDTLTVWDLSCQVLFTPGHTLTHHCFYIAQLGVLLVGDTLFSCGCGRLFEGTAEQMLTSLLMLSALPPSTRVYCAHEYTRRNIDFCLSIDPTHAGLNNYRQSVTLPSIPTTIEREKRCNPFLRSSHPELQQQLQSMGHQCDDALSTFTVLRQLRDNY